MLQMTVWWFLILATIPLKVLCFSSTPSNNGEKNVPLLPTDPDSMVRQAASSVQSALVDDKIHRQTIRLPLSETMYGGKEESFVADRAIGWQGGPQETYRFLSPMAQQLLRQVSSTREGDTSGLTPKIGEQILLDFDGSALLNAESPMGALYDSLALLQPNTDSYYLDLIAKMEDEFSDTRNKAKRLFLLINPAWRDASSWVGGNTSTETITKAQKYQHKLPQKWQDYLM